MTEKENRPGAPISISRDIEEGEDMINIRDAEGKLIMKTQKILWDGSAGAGFTPEIRDSIMKATRGLYG